MGSSRYGFATNINFLELAVFLALKHFLQFLRSCHVLIRTDNTTVVAYISCKGGPIDSVEQHSAQLIASDACSRNHEHQSRSPLQRKPPLPGMKASPSGGQPDLGETSKGFRRSLCLARKCSMSTVLFSHGHLCTAGCGCLGTTMAKRTPVCISAAQPNSSA